MLTEKKVAHLRNIIENEILQDSELDYTKQLAINVHSFLAHFEEVEEADHNILTAKLILMYKNIVSYCISNHISTIDIYNNLVNAADQLTTQKPTSDELFTLVQQLGVQAIKGKVLWYNYIAICYAARLDFQIIYDVIVKANEAIELIQKPTDSSIH